MSADILLVGLAGVLTAAAPLLFAVIGETISERAGIINLSMNGTILLSAMGGFAVALATNSVVLGFLAGAAIGGAVALIVAFASITLRQSQVAVGFVLTLLCRDLSYFLGNPLMGVTGPRITIKQANRLYDKYPRTYLFGLTGGKHVIDGEGVAAFINHSCDPNCEVDEVKGRVVINAIRDIAAGEELTYDYNLYDGEDDAPCLCGAERCRGSLYSATHLRKLARKRAAAVATSAAS